MPFVGYILMRPHPALSLPFMTPLDLAFSIHTTHHAAARQALDESPPEIPAFWIHSSICDAVIQICEDLNLLPEADASSTLSDSALAAGPQQPTQSAANSAPTEDNPPLV